MQGEPKVHWPKVLASMKVPPKRKGNAAVEELTVAAVGLNESPSQKEGKLANPALGRRISAEPQ